MMLAVEDCVQFKEEVKTTLDDLIQGQKEVQVEFVKILDSPTVRDAQQLLLIYQVPWSLHKTGVLEMDEYHFVLVSWLIRSVSSNDLFSKATVKTPEDEEERCAAADHKRPTAPGWGRTGGDITPGPAEFRQHP